MTQIDLTPYLPGPLSKHIIETFYTCAPDVCRNNPLAVKIIAAQIINTCLGVYISDFPKPKPASMYIVLLGGPRSGKGTLLKIARAFYEAVSRHMQRTLAGEKGIKILGGATAEGLRDQLATAVYSRKKREWKELGPQGRVVQIWERVTPPSGSQFYETMAEILEGAWDSSCLDKERVMEGIRIRVDADSYYFSLLWDCHPERWGKVFSNLGGDYGTARRMLAVPIKGEVGGFGGEEESAEVVGELSLRTSQFARMIEPLFGFSILVTLPDLSRLRRTVETLKIEEKYREAIEDYTKRLLAAWIVDSTFNELVRRVIETREGSPPPSLPQSVYTEKCVIEPVRTSITSNNLNNFDAQVIHCLLGSKKPSNQLEPSNLGSGSDLSGRVIAVGEVWIRLLSSMYVGEGIEDERVAHYKSRLERFWDERVREGKPLYASKKEIWLKVFSGREQRTFEPLYKTLQGLGYIVVRRHGRAEYVFKPDAKYCGTCALYDEGCPAKDKEGVGPDPRDEPCELYKPMEV